MASPSSGDESLSDFTTQEDVESNGSEFEEEPRLETDDLDLAQLTPGEREVLPILTTLALHGLIVKVENRDPVVCLLLPRRLRTAAVS